jgi:hypothetical protein
VLRLYRTDQHEPAATTTDNGLAPPGVYRYRTSGSESLSFAGTDRGFPSDTDIVVTGARCDTDQWEALAEHVEAMVVCRGPGKSIEMVSSTTYEQIAGITDKSVLTCSRGTYLVPPDPAPGAQWRSSCRSPGLRVTVTGRVVGSEPVRVGKATVSALHTRVVLHFAGSETGSSPADYWFSSGDGLILRQRETSSISQAAGPLGAIHYSEQMQVVLESLVPAR